MDEKEVFHLCLEGPLTVPYAEAIQAQILSALDGAGSVLIDVSATTAIDVSFLQILVAAQKTASQDRKALRIREAGSAALVTEIGRCGLPNSSGIDGARALPSFTTGTPS